MSFWGELKRRNVFKVGAAYVIVAWLIVQVANTFFPILHLPDWAVTLVACLLILGFPVALIHAWAYEVTPDGIKRTKEVPLAESITKITGRKLNYVLAGLLIVAVGYIVIDKVFVRGPAETEMTHPIVELATPEIKVEEEQKTIAVLPFTDLSPEKNQEYFVDGLSEEILNSLTKIQDLRVIARTSSFTFKGTDKKIQEIANELGANHILEGSVRKAENELRITAQLIRAVDGIHLWSETYDRKLEDIFAIQEDIANAVAEELKVTLGIGHSFKKPGDTNNLEAYEFFLVAQGQISNTQYRLALASLDSALAIDPEFALAWASKATVHIFNTVLSPIKDVASQREEGLRAAERAIELAPDLAAGYYALGYVKTTAGDYIEGGKAYRKALALSDEPLSFIMPVIAIHYQTVGYFDKEVKLLEKMLRNDPLNQGTRVFYIICLGFLGDTFGAEEEYERDKALFGDTFGSNDPGITIVRLGAGGRISPDKLVYSDPVVEAVKTHLDSPEEGLSELRRLYSDADELSAMSLAMMALCAAYFGDSEFALEVLEKAVGNVAEYVFMLWQPVMWEVRQLPRFKEFIREIGLVDYWRQFGWPDICQPTGGGGFVCD